MAADSFIRNLQRRSKKWRRSSEEPVKNETEVKEGDNCQDKKVLHDENGNVDIEVKDTGKGDDTPPCSPGRSRSIRKNAMAFPVNPRPVSLGLPSNFQVREQQDTLRAKVLSDPSLTKEKLLESSNVWIPRQSAAVARRRTSRHSVCSRNSSIFSDSASPLSGSKRSLSHISQESLADSGVSETPGGSPSNTLTTRTRINSTPERGEKLSHSLTDVTNPLSGETQRKVSQLSRRSWGDWISAEMKMTPENTPVDSEDQTPDDAGAKNKRKFKDVMKQLFSSKKK